MVLKDMEQGIIRDFYLDEGKIRTWDTNKKILLQGRAKYKQYPGRHKSYGIQISED